MERVRELCLRRGASELRWTLGPAHSTRAYELRSAVENHFCVSSRRAELTVVLAGELALQIGPARRELVLGPGSLCLVLPRTPHRLHAARDARFVVVDVPEARRGGVVVGRGGGLARRERFLRALWEQATDVVDGAWNPDVEWALGELRTSAVTRQDEAHDTRRALAVKDYLDDNYLTPLAVGEAAEAHGLDRFYLSRSFKKNFGVTPMSYVQFLRFEHFAWSLMRHGDARSLTDLSGEAGFGDYSTFSRRMRALLGKPPSRIFASA